MIQTLFLLLSILFSNEIYQDLDVIKQDNAYLIEVFNRPFLIKNEKQLIRSLENLEYVKREDEPIYIKILKRYYQLAPEKQKLKKLYNKYHLASEFLQYDYPKIEYFQELPLRYLKKNYPQKPKTIQDIQNVTTPTRLETYCTFQSKHSIYLYNDFSDHLYINEEKAEGNAFIVSNEGHPVFKLSFKNPKNPKGILYTKGAMCHPKFLRDYSPHKITVKKLPIKPIPKNEEVELPVHIEEVKALIKENTCLASYKLYHYFVLNHLIPTAYIYLNKWQNTCPNLASKQEQLSFKKEYLPNQLLTSKASKKTLKTIPTEKQSQVKLKPSSTFFAPKIYPLENLPAITENKILRKYIHIKQEKKQYYQYTYYLLSVKNAVKLLEYFRLASSIDILGVFTSTKIKEELVRIPAEIRATEAETFLKDIKNNSYLELYTKTKLSSVLFIPEKYFDIEHFKISFAPNIHYTLVHHMPSHQTELYNIKAFYPSPFHANTLDFLPYYLIQTEIKLPKELKWYYFYQGLKEQTLLAELLDQQTIKEAYHYLSKESSSENALENKALLLYQWSKTKQINTELLLFHIKEDLAGKKLFNYPIIKYKDTYLDLNTPNLRFGKLPLFLKGRDYIHFDKRGYYLYKAKEKILKDFVPNNYIQIQYDILKNLDYAEFEINITLYDHYTTGLRNMLKHYKDEEVIAQILELYINTKIKNATLIDYEIKHKKEIDQPMHLYIKGVTKNPLNFFEIITENKGIENYMERIQLKNYFFELFSPFFNQRPTLISYIYNQKIINPIQVSMGYQEDLDLSIRLLDQHYHFITSSKKQIPQLHIKPNTLQFKHSFSLSKNLITPKDFPSFYKKIFQELQLKKNLFNNIQIRRKNAK